MNDVLSQLQKIGSWLWLQKEKLVLLALGIYLVYRVYVVAWKTPETVETPPVKVTTVQPVQPPPPFPPMRPPLSDTAALISRNPFTIYGVQQGGSTTRTEDVQIPVVLERIVPWRDGELRAMLVTRGNRARPYKQGEPFESYTLEKIDQDANTVDVYSQEHDRTFTLHAQGGG